MSDFVNQSGVMIISGGQTGVDIAGLRAGHCLGFRTGGWAPRGFRTQAGLKPKLGSVFNLREHSGGYTARTWKNVDASSVTLIIAADANSAGTKMTINACDELNAPYRVVLLTPLNKPGHLTYDVPGTEVQRGLLDWIKEESAKGISEYGMFAINVAGNSSVTAPGIFPSAFLFLFALFGRLYIERTQELGGTPNERMLQLSQRLFNPNAAQGLADSYEYYPDLDLRRASLLVDGDFTRVAA